MSVTLFSLLYDIISCAECAFRCPASLDRIVRKKIYVTSASTMKIEAWSALLLRVRILSIEDWTEQESEIVCPDRTAFRVWRCLVTHHKMQTMDAPSLEEALYTLVHLQSWAVVLARGGHFAAARFEKSNPSNQKTRGTFYTVKQHKTLHRYVIRCD